MTVEDIVEELLGDIEDEHDLVELLEEKINQSTYNFSARLDVDYLNETYRLNLPESENYETLGGLILNSTEEIPLKDEVVTIENFQFKIIESSSTKIEVVSLQILDEE